MASLFQVREFIAHTTGGYHVETAFVAADSLPEACAAWMRETQTNPHSFMYITTAETAKLFGSVVSVEAWQSQQYSEAQFAKWRAVNVGTAWVRLADAVKRQPGLMR